MATSVSDHQFGIGVKGGDQLYLESVYGLYWKRLFQLPVVCRLQQSFQITNPTLDTKVNIKSS